MRYQVIHDEGIHTAPQADIVHDHHSVDDIQADDEVADDEVEDGRGVITY